MSTIQHMNRFYNANILVTGIARYPTQEHRDKFPEANFLSIDISKTPIKLEIKPDCIFNAATPSTPAHGGENSEQVIGASHSGTKNLIDVCESSTKTTFINLSSGIVTKRINDKSLNLDNVKDAYLEGKRSGEKLVIDATADGIVRGTNLRLYAFAGPGISLTDHFAVGNFMNDALHGRPILIRGNPETRRSYLYPTDLISNILASAGTQSEGVQEIGSRVDISMIDLAVKINSVMDNKGINQSAEYGQPDSYYPTTSETLLKQEVFLEEAITRWATWLRKN